MKECIFCRIAAKEIPAEIVYEDDQVVAFNDLHPLAPVHVLFVPRKHISDLTALQKEDAELIGHIHMAAVQVARERGIAERGFRFVNNCKKEGGQEVDHLHFHLLGGRQMRGLG